MCTQVSSLELATPSLLSVCAILRTCWLTPLTGQRLLALHRTHGLSGAALHAWCREKGLFEHQLITWHDAFCAVASSESRESKLAVPAYFSPSWTAFQADGGRDFSVIVDGVSV